ncbi:MAG: tripartite tricarboxylate transporter TctB family protein [Gammaproteobacteria bacterium]|nr:tripartite tricarboxylate transporter TctB family protein [Gammaproteobacteria bacterium]
MIKLDRIIALALLAFSLAYAWLAYSYELLPFELNLPFKPNTMPIGLSVIGIVLSFAVLVLPQRTDAAVMDESTVDTQEQKAEQAQYDWIRPLLLIILMIVYALSLRPFGFIAATAGFLVFSSIVLGERKFHFLIPVALTGAFSIWYVVQELLGIYMNPWPLVFG